MRFSITLITFVLKQYVQLDLMATFILKPLTETLRVSMFTLWTDPTWPGYRISGGVALPLRTSTATATTTYYWLGLFGETGPLRKLTVNKDSRGEYFVFLFSNETVLPEVGTMNFLNDETQITGQEARNWAVRLEYIKGMLKHLPDCSPTNTTSFLSFATLLLSFLICVLQYIPIGTRDLVFL